MKLKEKSNTSSLAYELATNRGDHRWVIAFGIERSGCPTFIWAPGHAGSTCCSTSFAATAASGFISHLGPVEIHRETVHETADGRRLLVLHGDEFDSALRCNALASLIGCAGYGLLLGLNRLTHGVNALLRRPYWSLAQAVKMRIGKAARYVARFQEACLDAARDAGLDGVVCGHIHRADLIERKGLVYCNDGDWVESCTALAEDDRGRLALIQWGQSAVTVDEALPEPLRDAA